MDSLSYKTTILFLYVFIVLITLLNISTASETQCSPKENLKWNVKKKKCVECPDCHPGFYRNLSEQYTRRIGKHGAERCIRCRPCPKGTFSRDGYGECTQCRVNCTELDREFAEPCTNMHDAKCGSCLNGFEDIFKNTQFPCAPKSKKTMRFIEPPKKSNGQHNTAERQLEKQVNGLVGVKSSPEQNADMKTDDSTRLQPVKQPSRETQNVLIGIIVFVAVLICSIVGIATARVYKKRRNVTHRRNHSYYQGTYNGVNDLSRDDIEMDTFAIETDTNHPACETKPTNVRAELDPTLHQFLPPHPRPEIRHPTSTANFNGIVYVQLPGQPSNVYCYENKDICQCKVNKQCKCQSYDFSEIIDIEKSDEYVLEVASNVCHDPCSLFRHLGLEDPTIYQEDNSRDRDPVKFSQKDLVINLLHRWLEVKSTPTTLKQLSLALCRADFHNINDKLYDVYIKNILSV